MCSSFPTALLNSPSLAAYSLIIFPIFLRMCFAEEQALLWRHGDACIDNFSDFLKLLFVRMGSVHPRMNKTHNNYRASDEEECYT
jgi:hypothetical protein